MSPERPAASASAGRVIDLRLGPATRLRARLWEGDGRPLVLLHGLLDDSRGWRRLAAASGRPCVAFDLPGFGGSTPPPRPRLACYAEAVCDGLARLGVAPGLLVGHSLGGGVAVLTAELLGAGHPLLLLAPAGFGRVRLAEWAACPGIMHVTQRALPLALANPLAVAAGYATVVAPRRLPSRELLARLAVESLRCGPGLSAAVQAIAAAGRAPFAAGHAGPRLDGPVRAVWGSRDGVISPSHAEVLRAVLPQARVEVWPGMGHHPQREAHDALAACVLRMLEAGGGGAGRLAPRATPVAAGRG